MTEKMIENRVKKLQSLEAQQKGGGDMNNRTEMIHLIVDMLQQASDRKVRFVYVLLRAMMGEEETA